MKKAVLPLLIIIFTTIVNAQIAQINSLPKGFNYEKAFQNKRKSILLPSFDLQKYINEDAVQSKDVAQRFAAPIEVKLNLNNGIWTDLPDGGKIWQLEVISENALNLNFQFSQFFLPIGGEFYLYSSDKKDIRGAFTSENNRIDNSFAVYLIKGESVVLEYYQPNITTELPKIEIERVLHGYKSTQGFGQSGSCNNNVNCPAGLDWQNEKKSVALIVSGGVNGTRWCSGAMINNEREDGTPFFLTANHCLTGTENNWAFIYNYESPNCTDIDGSFSESVLGATVLASGFDSDFALLLLDNIPPTTYNTYHSGWDANDVLKDSVVGVHHPKGDIKKISFDYDSIESSGYYSIGNDHWEVLDWDTGTTEPTSSGSPLYDKNHRIIGQLHGGDAACGNNDEDYYGKFSYSWNTGTLPSTQLMHWLDPDSTGVTVLDGANFNIPLNNLDVAATFLTVEDYCDTIVSGVEIVFKNMGSDTVKNIQIRAFVDNDSLEWSTINTALPFASSDAFVLSDFLVKEGSHKLKIIITNPNNKVDDNKLNDTIIRRFNAINGNKITININTDFFGNETGVEIYDENFNSIYSKIGFPEFSSIDIENCLSDGCYSVKITDDANDGITNGDIYFLNGGIKFDSLSGSFASETSLEFCVCGGIIVPSIDSVNCKKIKSINENNNSTLKIFPNPSNGVFNIISSSIISEIHVVDIFGKTIFTATPETLFQFNYALDLLEFSKGIYFIQIGNGKNMDVRKIVIK